MASYNELSLAKTNAEKKLHKLFKDYYKYRKNNEQIDEHKETDNNMIKSKKTSKYFDIITNILKNIHLEFEANGYYGKIMINRGMYPDIYPNDMLSNDLKSVRYSLMPEKNQDVIVKHINALYKLNKKDRILANYYFDRLFTDTYFNNHNDVREMLHKEKLIDGTFETNYQHYIHKFNEYYIILIKLDDNKFFEIIGKIEAIKV